jgi:hypothetical protein
MKEMDPYRILRMLLEWDEARHGPPSTWDIGRGTCIGGVWAARILEILKAQGDAVSVGRDRAGARLWRLTEQGKASAREALSA